MSHVFWIDHAWDTAVGPAWPRLESADADRTRILPVLLRYWDERSARCDAATLAPAARAALRERMNDSGRALRAGYEYVRRAADLDPVAFWSLDLGSAAWGIVITAACKASEPSSEKVRELLSVWRGKGLASIADELDPMPIGPDAGWQLIMRSLVRFYVNRDARAAIDDLDRGLTRLPPEARVHLGVTVPLTYALMLAIVEGPAQALARIDQTLAGDAWSRAERAEILYHRLRLLRTGAGEVTADDLLVLIREDPSVLIRLLTDRAFGDGHMIRTATGPVAEQIRSEMIRWQRRMPVPEGTDPFSEVRLLLRLGGDVYTLFAAQAARVRAIQSGAHEPYFAPPGFALQMREIEAYVTNGPPGLPLCLGTGSPPFCGQDGSLWAEIRAEAAGDLDESVVARVEAIHRLLPDGVRIALLEHAERLLEALKAAYEIAKGEPARQDYVQRLGAWGTACMKAYDEVGRLPDYTGEALGRAASSIWDEFAGIETAWSQYLRHEYGQIVVRADENVEIPVGGWRAVTCRVADVRGTPIPGAPLVWWVEEGPSGAREAAQCLFDSWAHSLKTGLAYLALSAPETAQKGETGIIAIRPAGAQAPVRVRYTIV